MLNQQNIFITGATGFIGENLAFKLAEENHVFALVRPGSIKKTAGFGDKGIKIITADLLDSNSYAKELNGIDYVFHLAALFKLEASKEELYKYNVLGTERLLGSCLNKNIKKIIFFSTAYVSGTKEKEFITEDEPHPRKFKNWYEWSKAEAEKVALDFYKRYGLPIVIVRPAIVYGPGNSYGFYNALSLISEGKLCIIPGDGKNKVHLVHIDDVVNAVMHLAQLENVSGEIYHICDSSPQPSAELIKLICRRLNIKPPYLTSPRTIVRLLSRSPLWKLLFRGISGELLDYFLYNQTYSNAKIKSAGYFFQYSSLVNGLKSTINWYLEKDILKKS